MTTIIYIPLDERPVNLLFPQALLESHSDSQITLLIPPAELLGTKKTPADLNGLWRWTEEQLPQADQLLCSLDMLIYGGIVPSRLHQYSQGEAEAALQRFAGLKTRYPKLKTFAFNLIMRVPAYNSSDEEPDYYGQYGEAIFRWGWIVDWQDRRQGDGSTSEELSEILKTIPGEVQEDYLTRRALNHFVNVEAIKLAEQGAIDFLVIPLDDCAEFGFSAAEQRKLIRELEERRLQGRVHLYPGADEVGSTLLCRLHNEVKGYKPRVFVRYSSTMGPQMIPRYEDRPLGESIKSQITVCGGIMVDSSLEADLVLMVNSPTLNHGTMQEAAQALRDKDPSYHSFRNLREFVESIRYHVSSGRRVALADVAFGNGADHELMQMLAGENLLKDLHSYAAWNTPGNSLGTVLAHSLIKLQDGRNPAGKPCKFLLDRYLEDWGYQVLVRTYLARNAKELGITYSDLKGRQPQIRAIALEMLQDFIRIHLGPCADDYQLESVYFPWNRLFEVGLDTKLIR